jgi:acyl-CoA hydrolase
MDTYAIVRPEHLNHHGYLFGGAMLKWVDEFAWIAASLDFPGSTMVTRAMENVEFRRRAVNGAILRFNILPARRGTTSVTYAVTVWADEPGATEEVEICAITVTFVRLDAAGQKLALPEKGRLRSEG